MSSTYIDVPVDTNPDTLAELAFQHLQAKYPGWSPAAANLDTVMIEAITLIAAEVRDVASRVPRSIYRTFGASLMNIPPVDAVAATGQTTWTMVSNAGFTIPAGTLIGLRAAGDVLVAFKTVNTVTVPPGSTTTAAGAIFIQALEQGTIGNGLIGPAELIDPLDYVLSIATTAPTGAGQEAEDDDTYLGRLTEELKLLTPTPIVPDDFALLAKALIPGVNRALAVDGYNPNYNILTLNQASAETDATGWAAGALCTLASSSAQAADGAKSVSMTATGPGTMQSAVPAVTATVAVTPGETWTGLVSFRANTTARSCVVSLWWYTSGGVFISNSDGSGANDSNAGWASLTATGVAPATAAYVKIVVSVLAVATSEVHYVDKASLHRGGSAVWSAGGTIETGNERMITVAAIDENGNAVSAPVKSAIDAMLQSLREATFIVNMADPTYTQIQVTYSIKVLPGFVAATVIADVSAALASYLSPANWGFIETGAEWQSITSVRYLELATVINGVSGVDYVSALTLGYQGGALAAADVPIAGVAALPTAGTITGTAI